MNARSLRISLSITVVLGIVALAGASDDLTSRAALKDLVAYGLANNPGLHAAAAERDGARAGVAVAGGWPDPKISAGHFLEPIETKVGPQRLRLGLTQAIPWSGRLGLAREMAATSAEIARLRYAESRRRLVFQIRSAYAEYRHAQQVVILTAERAALIAQLAEIVRARHVTGEAQSALLRVQMESAVLRETQERAEDRVVAVRAQLNALLGRRAGAPLADAESQPVALEIARPTEEDLAAHPALLIPQREAARQGVARRVARFRYLPDLIVGLQWIQIDEIPLPGLADNGKDPIIVSVGASLPLWFTKHRAAQEQARMRAEAARWRATETAQRLSAELWQAYSEWHASARRVDLYRHTLVPTAEQTSTVTLQAYTSGTTSFTDLIDVQRQILEYHLALERALADCAQQAAHIEYLITEED